MGVGDRRSSLGDYRNDERAGEAQIHEKSRNAIQTLPMRILRHFPNQANTIDALHPISQISTYAVVKCIRDLTDSNWRTLCGTEPQHRYKQKRRPTRP